MTQKLTDTELEYYQSNTQVETYLDKVKSKREEHLQLITDCLTPKRSGRLTPWQREFVSDLQDILEKGYSLTRKQELKLNEAWERATELG